MNTRLLVTEAFGDYSLGDRIEDAAEKKRVLATHPNFVLQEIMPATDKDAKPPAVKAPASAAKPAATLTADAKPAVTRVTLND